MTEYEKRYFEDVAAIHSFLKERNMQAYELMRIAKKMCSCGTCDFFEQHYTKEGESLDWGHCFKGNIQHSKKISTQACGSWRCEV